jgi:hypothetical protein
MGDSCHSEVKNSTSIGLAHSSLHRGARQSQIVVMTDTIESAPRDSDVLAGAAERLWIGPCQAASVAVLALVLAMVVLCCLVARHIELETDEAYYWLWSRHLAISYFDHPPMIAYLIRLGTALVSRHAGDVVLGGRGRSSTPAPARRSTANGGISPAPPWGCCCSANIPASSFSPALPRWIDRATSVQPGHRLECRASLDVIRQAIRPYARFFRRRPRQRRHVRRCPGAVRVAADFCLRHRRSCRRELIFPSARKARRRSSRPARQHRLQPHRSRPDQRSARLLSSSGSARHPTTRPSMGSATSITR